MPVDKIALVGEPHQSLEDIHFLAGRQSFLCQQLGIGTWEITQRLKVTIQFEIQIALELTTLSGKLLRVERELLVARCCCGHTTEIRQPSRTADLPTTGAYSS